MNLKNIKEEVKKHGVIGTQTILELVERIEALEAELQEAESEIMTQNCQSWERLFGRG